MSSNSLFSNAIKLSSLLDSLFSVDLDIQLKFLKNFPEPKDDFERSYYQYRCQRFLQKEYKNLLHSLLSFFALFPLIAFLLMRKKQRYSQSSNNVAVFIFAGTTDLMPDSLMKKYDKIEMISFGENYYLLKSDLLFIFKLLIRFPFAPYFIIKNIYKIALYRSIIQCYSPSAIICTSEYSFTSSVLTAYCEEQNITHINVQHGEKFLFIRDSFFRFHEFYIWDEFYVYIFNSLRADKSQYLVELPPCFKINIINKEKADFDYTYYLGGEDEEDMRRIRDALVRLESNSNRISIRPHPRYSNKEHVSKVFSSFHVEEIDTISIAQSFEQTRGIIALYSTVLFQGSLLGKEVVIDDVTDRSKYEKLKTLKYIMISKKHKRLSDLIK